MHELELATKLTCEITPVNSWHILPCQNMAQNNACEVRPRVNVNLWLAKPRVNLSIEQSIFKGKEWVK